MITTFKGRNFYLSNYFTAPVRYDGITYQNNEAAFQAQKCVDPRDRMAFIGLPPNKAKAMGRRVKLRKDWEDVKNRIMYEICLAKFTQNKKLKEVLISTKDEELIEGNTWNDTYWGVCNDKGLNMLGKILMRVRSELRGDE
jgi:ribA/ribD-fused uncharacterized protein|nr:MAG TPA: hypothetical protein [Caudoviricetes sp.]